MFQDFMYEFHIGGNVKILFVINSQDGLVKNVGFQKTETSWIFALPFAILHEQITKPLDLPTRFLLPLRRK